MVPAGRTGIALVRRPVTDERRRCQGSGWGYDYGYDHDNDNDNENCGSGRVITTPGAPSA